MVNFKRIGLFVAGLLPFITAAPVSPDANVDSPVNVENKYIITLKSGVTSRDIESHLSWVGDVHKRSFGRRDLAGVEKTYDIGDFHGYAGNFDEATIEEIKSSPDVRLHVSIRLIDDC